MTFKDVIVQVAEGADCANRVNLAISIVRTHDAHLIGLYVEPPLLMTVYPEISMPSEVIDAEIANAAASVAALKQMFIDATTKAGINAQWRQSHADSVTAFNINGRYADLLIIGHSANGLAGTIETTISKHVALESGRPVLVVPCATTVNVVGRRVLVGWNGGREAVRAVHDALPFLVGAEFVQVMAINPGTGYDDHGAVPCADICLHLAHHGIKAEAHVAHAESGALGASLLQQATAIGADLVVIGAYGHSRFRQLILGGVTQYLLQHMTVPMLMSH